MGRPVATLKIWRQSPVPFTSYKRTNIHTNKQTDIQTASYTEWVKKQTPYINPIIIF